MSSIVRAVLYAVIGGLLCGAAVFAGGFLLAAVLGPSAQQTLGMLVPMMLTPLAALIGGAYCGWKGYRRA